MKEHTSCYKNPFWLPVAILIFGFALSIFLFAFIGLAFIFAFQTAHMFMAKNENPIRDKMNEMCDGMKFVRLPE
jgi:hypothetical protein